MDLKFIHIGHHKCGSSFIQFEVIPKIKALNNVPFKDSGGMTVIHDELMNLIRCDDLFYDESTIKDKILSTKFNCLSYEGLVGHGSLEASAGYQIEHTAQRLKNLFGRTKILFIIRNQKTFLESWYKDDIKFGFVASFKKWFMQRLLYTQLNWIKYSSIIKVYNNLFGSENVKVVLFENLFKKESIANILNEF